MKKIILVFSFLVVAVIGAGLYYFFTNLDALVKAAIEEVGSQTTQTAVRVDKVKIVLSDGAGTISGLSIANTKGFEARYAFSLGTISTHINIKSLQSLGKEPIIIDKVIIREPQVFYEMNKDRKNNLNMLYNNIDAATAASGGADKAAANSAEPRLIIRRFLFTDATVHANVVPLNNKKYTLKLPTIDLKNLGGKNGATPSEISQQVLSIITKRALARVKREGIDAKTQALKSKAQKKLDTKKREVESQVGEKLKNLLRK